MGCGRGPRRAFTLIEVLVVVAIIALLAAILMPSLRAARTQAKITVCIANSKQIATMITQYRTDYRDYVPVMYNYWANTDGGTRWKHPARTCWLSVALRHYYPSLRNLKGMMSGRFDPGDTWSEADPMRGVWTDALRTEYEDKILPEFFMCPFERGKGAHRAFWRTINQNERHLTYEGKFESYHTWLWNAVDRGTQLNSSTAPVAWLAKYPVLIWNKGVEQNNNHTKWDVSRAEGRVAGALSLSEFTVVYCGQGEWTPFADPPNVTRRANVNGHYRNVGGGTNAVFADTHVEWIVGKQIGKP